MTSKPSNEQIQKLFAESAAKMQGGDYQGARNGLEQVASHIPRHDTVQFHLGMCYQYLGMVDEAIDQYSILCQRNPRHVEALINLGLAHQAKAQFDLAIGYSEKALAVQPGHPRAINLLGTTYAAKGDYGNAIGNFEKLVALDGNNRDARFNLAIAFYEGRDWDRAFNALLPIVNDQSDRALLLLFGQILLKQKHLTRLSSCLNQLNTTYPDDPEVGLLQMYSFEAVKDHRKVIEKALLLVDKQPDSHEVWDALGQAYFLSGETDKAMECYEKAINLAPNVAKYHNSIGLVYSSQGEKDEAESSYRKAIAMNPRYGEAYRSLSALKTFKSLEDQDIELFEQSWEKQQLDDFARCKLAFALGKAYDDCGEYDKAFEKYQEGNELRGISPNDVTNKHVLNFEYIANAFNAPPPAGASDRGNPLPLFILGMPRSGSTLVEHILARHSEITACGELPFIERSIASIENQTSGGLRYPQEFFQLSHSQCFQAADQYIKSVAESHHLSTNMFTDKMPLNFRHIWMIKSLFSNSKIIHCKRHPLDIILSNYFQLYGSDAMDFVYDLKILARYYVGYHRLMDHWSKLFGSQIYTVQYEALVTNSETETKKLIDAMGIPWEEGCLRQDSSTATVRTASIWQVRKEIYTSSIQRWQHYREYFEDAAKILQQENILDQNLQEILS